MSLAHSGARAPRAPSRFAAIKASLFRRQRYINHAWRRSIVTRPPMLHRDAPRGALQAGIEPLRLLQDILDHADVIALDVRERGHPRAAHLLVTLPIGLLERATEIASYDTDDEATNDEEPGEDDEEGGDEEPSLASPDGLIDQRRLAECRLPADHVANWGYAIDLEADRSDYEPSLGSQDAEIDQEHWGAGDRLDRERSAGGGDCDDDEENGDREADSCDLGEPDDDNEPDERDWPMHGDHEADMMTRSLAFERSREYRPQPGDTVAEVAPSSVKVWLPTGNGNELRNEATGEPGRGMLLPRHGEAP